MRKSTTHNDKTNSFPPLITPMANSGHLWRSGSTLNCKLFRMSVLSLINQAPNTSLNSDRAEARRVTLCVGRHQNGISQSCRISILSMSSTRRAHTLSSTTKVSPGCSRAKRSASAVALASLWCRCVGFRLSGFHTNQNGAYVSLLLMFFLSGPVPNNLIERDARKSRAPLIACVVRQTSNAAAVAKLTLNPLALRCPPPPYCFATSETSTPSSFDRRLNTRPSGVSQ